MPCSKAFWLSGAADLLSFTQHSLSLGCGTLLPSMLKIELEDFVSSTGLWAKLLLRFVFSVNFREWQRQTGR